jgi:hypothetical protein
VLEEGLEVVAACALVLTVGLVVRALADRREPQLTHECQSPGVMLRT